MLRCFQRRHFRRCIASFARACPEYTHDRPLYQEIEAVRTLCENGSLLVAARQHIELL